MTVLLAGKPAGSILLCEGNCAMRKIHSMDLGGKRFAMNTRRVLCLSAALLVPQLAGAKLPLPNDSFGKIEGILDFCAKADPESASKYEERKKLIVDDATEKEVAEARKAQEYKDGYKGISEELAKAPIDKAASACSAYLEGK